MPKRNVIPATVEMWREACNIRENNDPGHTITELAEMMGCARSTTSIRVKALVKEGKCTEGLSMRIAPDGHRHIAAVYELK